MECEVERGSFSLLSGQHLSKDKVTLQQRFSNGNSSTTRGKIEESEMSEIDEGERVMIVREQ